MRTITIFIFLNLCIIVANAQYMKTFGFRPVNMANTEIVQSVSSEYAGELWQFPKQEIIDTVTYGHNLFGADRVGTEKFNVAVNIKDVEPSSFSYIHVLENKNILAICPLSISNNISSPGNGIRNVRLFYPGKVSIVLLDFISGKTIWESIITAYGYFAIIESGNQLYIKSQNYSHDGIKGEFLHALDKSNGKVLFEKGDISTQKIEIFLEQKMILHIEKESVDLIKYTIYKTDGNTILFSKKFTKTDLLFEPYIIEDKMLFINSNKLCFYEISKAKKIWEIEIDMNLREKIIVHSNKVYVPLSDNICQLDLNSGRKLWEYPFEKDKYVGVDFIDGNVFLIHQTETPKNHDKNTQKLLTKYMDSEKLSKKYKNKPFELIDIEQYEYKTKIVSIGLLGKKNWEIELDGVKNSNFFVENDKLYLITNKFLYSIDIQKGKLLKNSCLHGNSLFCQYIIEQVNKNLIVKSDNWVFCFESQNLDSIYAHHFDLVFSAFTVEELKRDMATQIWVMEKSLSRQTIKTPYNDFSKLGLSIGMGSLVNSAQIAKNVYLVLTVHALLSQEDSRQFAFYESDRITNLDNDRMVVRLVKKAEKGQLFIALESLELETGVLKSQILSPFQFKEDLITLYTSFGSVFAVTGYLHANNVRDHVFRTCIDWKNERIYHYGSGLNVETYRYYNVKKPEFIRGKLICLPFDFKVDKKYL